MSGGMKETGEILFDCGMKKIVYRRYQAMSSTSYRVYYRKPITNVPTKGGAGYVINFVMFAEGKIWNKSKIDYICSLL